MNHFTRRELIELSALALLGVTLGCDGEGKPSGQLDSKMKQRLDKFRQEHPALMKAEAAGKIWLEGLAEIPNEAAVYTRVFGSKMIEKPAVIKDVLSRHQADLRAHRIYPLNGWQLSQTEVHLYGLLALTRVPKKA